jgi:uncharacterized protein YdeI (YjbR/CyaY-like superfamily)
MLTTTKSAPLPLSVRPRSTLEWRRWLARHHASASAVLVVFAKKGSGSRSLTWQESVDEALCFGWVDGVRGSVDAGHFSVRFTPRKPGSIWRRGIPSRAAILAAAGKKA